MAKRLFLIVVALFWAVSASAQTGYRIKAGDRLNIEVLEDSSLSRQVLVLPDGSISFPLAGAVRAGGQTTSALESTLASSLAPNFAASPTVFVSVLAISERESAARTIDVYLMGETNRKGRVEVERGTTILQMLAEAGGFTKFAATKRIQLRRTDPQTGTDVVFLFNYKALEDGARVSGQTILADGDVIVVPQRKLFE